MHLSKNKLNSYEEYLKSLNKKSLKEFLDNLEVEYNSSAKSQDLVDLIIEELDDIIYKVLDYLTLEEYRKMKYIVKHKGSVKIKTSVGLLKFCEYLTNHKLMENTGEKKYALYKEVYNILKIKIKSKKIYQKCQKNSNEYKLIEGTTMVYGAINLKDFYNIYCEKYAMSETGLKEYLIGLKKYNNRFKIYEEKNNAYLANVKLTNIKECKKYSDKKNWAKFSATEIQSLYTLRYMKKYKSYRKLRKFIEDSYYIDDDNFKIVVEKILNPFLMEYQLEKEKANDLLAKLIDEYFEFNSNKHKKKFITLAGELALDYPNWNLKGYNQRESKNEKKH